MNSRERLTRILHGKPPDRPGLSFYEIGGRQVDPTDPDPFNIYNDPSWDPLLRLAEEETDLILMRSPLLKPRHEVVHNEVFKTTVYTEGGSRFTRTEIIAGGRTLTRQVRRDPDIDTDWVVEHPLKDGNDLQSYLQLPDEALEWEVDTSNLEKTDREIGDRGIVMVDTADPICSAAALFHMEDFLLAAVQEKKRFHQLLEKLAAPLYEVTETVCARFPGHLWRIYGPEYATNPYLPTSLFEEYVVRYTEPMVRMILRTGGFPRIHCHGRIRDVLPYFVKMGAVATDPVEPPPQGDVELREVRREYGKDLVLFGNIEVSEIENLPPEAFEKRVRSALQEGTEGEGRGFVLMPSASPYGRKISDNTLQNYRTMVRLVREFSGN